MIPAASASAWRAAGERQQLVVGRGPRGLGRDRDPARFVRRPGHPCRELLGSVPGEDQVGMAVDEARKHAPPPGVEMLVRVGAGALDRDHRLVLDHERRVAHDPERPLADLGIVRDQEPDVVDRQRAHRVTAAIDSRSSPATSSSR